MASDKYNHENGIYFTPDALADYLLSKCPTFKAGRILDPACGDGALLKSAQRRYGVCGLKYVGCDKEAMKKPIKNVRFVHKDYFAYNTRGKFDLIVTNPPYVRVSYLPQKTRENLTRVEDSFCNIDKRSDLWVYFLLKSLSHLQKGGTLAAILPWSFFQAEYACGIRKYIAENFKNIKIQIISRPLFETTFQKIVLIWLYNKGEKVKRICCINSDSTALEELTLEEEVSQEDWIGGNTIRCTTQNCPLRKDIYALDDLCEIKIGLVPGASKFFIRPEKDFERLGVMPRYLKKIVRSSRDLNGLELRDTRDLFSVLALPKKAKARYSELIADGEANNYHLRCHCAQREPWYSLKFPAEAPDAFFSYRSTSLPICTINEAGVYATNSVLCLKWKKKVVEDCQKRWIQISLLSVLSLIDIESKAKVYGKNVLKIEPSALKSVRIYAPRKIIDNDVVGRIKTLLEKGHKEEAVVAATHYIFDNIKISQDEKNNIIAQYKRLWEQRMLKGYPVPFDA